jgi:flavin-dependent dehydrogenase
VAGNFLSKPVISNKFTYDYAIVGGGLAGLSLAIQLRKLGLHIVLFEKESYPFHKVCGEYMSMESWGFLEQLGVPLNQLNLPMIDTLVVSAPNGNSIKQALDLGGFGISRYTLDNMLFEIACKLGVEVHTACAVTEINDTCIKTSKGTFWSKHILGTWGKRSKMDAVLQRNFLQPQHRKLNDYIGVKYHVQADLPANTIELHNFKNGYCGISQIEENKYCMCYLVQGNELKRAGGNIKKMEEQLLIKNPFLHKYFTQYPSLYTKPLSISQISFEAKTQHENAIAMAGDAAGLITPLCGNGMSMALHASKLLAKQIGLVQTEKKPYNQALADYEMDWKSQFENRLKIGRFIQSLFGSPIGTNLLVGALKPFPAIVNLLVKQTHGKPF